MSSTVNIPQLLAVALVGFLALRWFLKPGSPSMTPSSSRQLDMSKVDQVSAMFPQVDRRSIAWDLSRNGSNVNGTTERILSGRGLENPPPSFQPNLPAAPSTSTSSSTSQGKSTQNQDLITRYGLQEKVNSKGKEPEPSDEMKRNAWSADKNARSAALARRKQDMVLAARRKMLEKEQQGIS